MKTNLLASIIKSNVVVDNKPKFYMCDIIFIMNDGKIVSPDNNPFFEKIPLGKNPIFNYDVFFVDATNYGKLHLQGNQFLAGDEILPRLLDLKEEDVIVVLKNKSQIRLIPLSEINQIIVQRGA